MTNTLTLENMTLAQKVAQLFIVGFSGPEPDENAHRFLQAGVGGVIFFRENFDSLPDAATVAGLLDTIKTGLPENAPLPFLSIDQEGGQVERLPHTMFPSTVTPRAIALCEGADALAEKTYGVMGEHLAALGFNMNFSPTLDVNLARQNPIIGVRAFADEPETVTRLGKIALSAYQKNSIVAVGKHFPGHGNGTVDSHAALPTLTFTEDELQAFQEAIQAGIPAILVAHGLYPGLQPEAELEAQLPSSLSPSIISGMLRNQLGFDGLVVSDDLCMGAITEHRSATEAALLALKAGTDILLYQQSSESEWAVFEAVCEAFQRGEDGLDAARLDASVQRILAAKAGMNLQASPSEAIQERFAPATVAALSDEIAQAAVSVRAGKTSLLPLRRHWPLLAVYPDRTKLGNYAYDLPTSAELPTLFQLDGFERVRSVAYQYLGDSPKLYLPEEIETLVFIAFNAVLDPMQQALYQTLTERYPDARVILVSAGTPYDPEVMTGADLHIALCSYRPASMRALVRTLAGPPLPEEAADSDLHEEEDDSDFHARYAEDYAREQAEADSESPESDEHDGEPPQN